MFCAFNSFMATVSGGKGGRVTEGTQGARGDWCGALFNPSKNAKMSKL